MHFRGWLIAAAAALAAGALAQETPEIEAMKKALGKELSLGSILKTDYRDDDDQKFERVKLVTEQNRDDSFVGTMRFTVELTGKNGEVWWGQILRKQAKRPPEYEGRDEWIFDFPHGDLRNPKITAYALEYGWETNSVFIPVEQEFYKVESADEITERNTDRKKKLKIKAKAKSFREESGGE